MFVCVSVFMNYKALEWAYRKKWGYVHRLGYWGFIIRLTLLRFIVCILHKSAYSQIKQDGLEFQILGPSWLLDFPDLSRLMHHCYYLYSVVCQQIWRNVLPLFFPRYTGIKKTQHYKLFISNPIVLFWRTKKKPTAT